ncbi:MAG: outer membrane protein assembly factor BamB family protein, partial [Candidatus Hodarchaeales archaeon]
REKSKWSLILNKSSSSFVILTLLIFSSSLELTSTATTNKSTIIWEHYFTEMTDKFDMAVREIAFSPETDRIFVSLVYINGTALYCLNSHTGDVVWRLKPLVTFNNSKFLIYVVDLVAGANEQRNFLFISGFYTNANNLSESDIPDWMNNQLFCGFSAKINITTGEILWFNPNCSSYAPVIVTGNFQNHEGIEIAVLTLESVLLLDEADGSVLWNYTFSREVSAPFSYMFACDSGYDYQDLMVCLEESNPRVVRLSGLDGTARWTFNDSWFLHLTQDAKVEDITGDDIPDVILAMDEATAAINGSTGDLLWYTPIRTFQFDIADLYNNGTKTVVGTELENIFFIQAITGKIYQQGVIEPNDYSTGVFIEDLNNDGKKEIVSPSFGSSIAILDASGQILHRISPRAWPSDFLVADVLGSSDLELVAGTVVFGWIGVMGHGLPSALETFFPLVVIGGSFGLLGLLGSYFWRKKYFMKKV